MFADELERADQLSQFPYKTLKGAWTPESEDDYTEEADADSVVREE